MIGKVAEIATQCGWEDWTQDDNWKHWASEERGYFVLADLEDFAALIIKECASNKNWEVTTDEVFGVPFNFEVLENMGIDVKTKLSFNAWKNECIQFDKIEYDLQFEFLSRHGIDVMAEVATVLKDEYWKYLLGRKYSHNEVIL